MIIKDTNDLRLIDDEGPSENTEGGDLLVAEEFDDEGDLEFTIAGGCYYYNKEEIHKLVDHLMGILNKVG